MAAEFTGIFWEKNWNEIQKHQYPYQIIATSLSSIYQCGIPCDIPHQTSYSNTEPAYVTSLCFDIKPVKTLKRLIAKRVYNVLCILELLDVFHSLLDEKKLAWRNILVFMVKL